jgi:hypothetical protein
MKREYDFSKGKRGPVITPEPGKTRITRQTDVPNTSERQLRRIEQTRAVSMRNLKHLADAHKMTLEVYLARVAARFSPRTPFSGWTTRQLQQRRAKPPMVSR